MDWTEYLKFAKELKDSTHFSVTEEVRWRVTISRAYYSVFHKACLFLQNTNSAKVNFNWALSQDSHNEVINEFRNHSDRRHKQVGHNLDRLKIDRVKADYRDQFEGINKQVTVDLALADEICSALDGLVSK